MLNYCQAKSFSGKDGMMKQKPKEEFVDVTMMISLTYECAYLNCSHNCTHVR